MGRVRRGGYVFVTWIGDHGRHVHVFRDNREVLKWELDLGVVIEGRTTRRLKRLIDELVREGKIG